MGVKVDQPTTDPRVADAARKTTKIRDRGPTAKRSEVVRDAILPRCRMPEPHSSRFYTAILPDDLARVADSADEGGRPRTAEHIECGCSPTEAQLKLVRVNISVSNDLTKVV